MNAGDLISGKYRLLRLLGAGGMGSVWAARNELTDHDFAVKFLLPVLSNNKDALTRFFLEARACGQIKHPAVVHVYDMGQAEDGSPYLVMELLEGEGFDQRLQRAGTFRPSEAATWVAFIARGLEEAHVRGLVHRDLKPGNVFFALDDRGDVIPKILDFGISKATKPQAGEGELVKTSTGAVVGSPAYMSPEQASGDPDVDGRSDVWALGVILYEALTGKLPFDAANYNALMVSIITKPHVSVSVVAPGVPLELSQIIDQALSKEKSKRIGTARELADRLEQLAMKSSDGPGAILQSRTPTFTGGNQPTPVTQNAWTGTSIFQRRQSPVMFFASAGLVALALAVGGFAAFQRLRPPMVAVAGRSGVALATSLSRLQGEVERIKAALVAEQKAKDEKSKGDTVVIEPGDLPPARTVLPIVPATAAPAGSAKAGKPRKHDVHGGVDSAGF